MPFVLNRCVGQPGSLFWFTFPYRSDDTALSSARRMPRLRPSTSRTVLSSLLPNITTTTLFLNTPLSTPLPSAFPTPRAPTMVLPTLVDGQGQEVRKSLPSKKILLVDDTPSIIKVIGRLLQVTTYPPLDTSNDNLC